jgi:hypothetical protein
LYLHAAHALLDPLFRDVNVSDDVLSSQLGWWLEEQRKTAKRRSGEAKGIFEHRSHNIKPAS